MSSVSGFDPLFSVLSNIDDISSKDIFVAPVSSKPTVYEKFLYCFGMGPLMAETQYTNPSYMERRHIKAALDLLNLAAQQKDALLFLSAAENQYCAQLSEADATIRKRTVLFLHQPPSWFRMHWPDDSVFEGLRALVCLSEEQKAYFEDVHSTPVVRISHGVCHDFFTPLHEPPDNPPQLLFVGQWLRDFDTLYAAMHGIWKTRDDVMLNCVIPGSVRDKTALMELAKDERVVWYEEIPPESLRQLYRKATLLFLPLIDCVANNAILEAMACGLPIVSTDIGGIRDYVNDECAVLCKPADVEAHVSAVLKVLDDKKFRDDAAIKSRARVEKCFNWKTIARLLMEKLEALPE